MSWLVERDALLAAGGPDRRMVRAVCQGIRSLFESPFRVRPARPFLHRRTLGATPNLLWGVVQYLLAWSGGPGGPSTGHGFTAKDGGRGSRRSTPKRVWGGTLVKRTLPMGCPPAGDDRAERGYSAEKRGDDREERGFSGEKRGDDREDRKKDGEKRRPTPSTRRPQPKRTALEG